MNEKPAWSANGATAAVSITFDNLGEAAELELGIWPKDQPLGQHFSVHEALPRLLDTLSSQSVRATFFIEGLNAEVYPETLRDLTERGHEVALHAWRHEHWANLDRNAESRLLVRATRAMRAAGLAPVGFRPPGGGLTANTGELLAAHGYRYASPAGDREGIDDGLSILPFRWSLVDAFAFMPQFAGLRERFSGSAEAIPPDEMSRAICASLTEHASTGGHLALLFHPFALAATGDPAWAALEQVLAAASQLANEDLVELMRMDEAADWMLGHPRDFSYAPRVDDATWMTSSG